MTTISIKPSFVKESTRYIGSLRLHQFQEDFLNSTKKYIFLNTPTGSGKTLAGLVKILCDSNRPQYEPIRSLITYPTNELINDQINALQDLIKKLEWESLLIIPDKIDDEITQNYNFQNFEVYLFDKLSNFAQPTSKQLILIPINSKILSDFVELNEGHKKLTHGAILLIIFKKLIDFNCNFIILSNIDFLFSLFSHKYSSSKRLFPEVFNINSIIIDEFHLYGGTLLGYIIQMVRLFHKQMFPNNEFSIYFWIGFLSATPTGLCEVFKESFSNLGIFEIIETKLEEDNDFINSKHQIRYETKLTFIPHDNILYYDEDLPFFVSAIINVIKSREFQENSFLGPVKLLIIVNSVIFAEKLFSKLQAELSLNMIKNPLNRIHGLIPTSERFNIRDATKSNSILIGTRAIEIGIDFDVPFLIFEGNEYYSFFQRLGRGGRKNSCCSWVVVPSEVLAVMRNIPNKEVSLRELNKSLENCIPADILFVDFLFSKQFLMFSLPFFGSLIYDDFYDFYHNKYKNIEHLGVKLRDKIKEIIRSLPNLKYQGKDIVGIEAFDEIIRNFFPTNTLKEASEIISCRGNVSSFLAYYDNWQSWNMINLEDLLKYDFSIVTFDRFTAIEQKRLPIRWNAFRERFIIRIHKIATEPKVLTFAWADPNTSVKNHKKLTRFAKLKAFTQYLHMSCEKSNPDVQEYSKSVESLISQILENRVSYLPILVADWDVKLNWKIKYFCLRTEFSKYALFIGDAAFLADYLINGLKNH